MKIKDREYYENFQADIDYNLHKIEYHIGQAERWKTIYNATKNVRGFKWLNRIAKRRNNAHFIKGSKLARENLDSCRKEINYLNDYLTKLKEEES